MEETSTVVSMSDTSGSKTSEHWVSAEATSPADKARNRPKNVTVIIVGVLLLTLMLVLVVLFVSWHASGTSRDVFYEDYYTPEEVEHQEPMEVGRKDDTIVLLPNEPPLHEPSTFETVRETAATTACTVVTTVHKTSPATEASTERTRRKRRKRSTRAMSTSTQVTSSASSSSVSTTVSSTTVSATTVSPTTVLPTTVSLMTVSATASPTTVSAALRTSQASTRTSSSPSTTTVSLKAAETTASSRDIAAGATTTMDTTTTTGPQNLARAMLCTLGSRTDTIRKVPPDGLCDLLFYTHAVLLTDRQSSEESFSIFLKAAQSAKVTLYGVSVDINKAVSTSKELKAADGQQIFRTLWHKNIRQHGILNAAGEDSDLDYFMEREFKLLQDFKGLQLKFNPVMLPGQPPSLVVLGVKMTKYISKKHRERFPVKLKEMARVFPIDILVVITHQSTWDMAEDYATSGASMWQNVNDVNEPSLSATIPLLKSAALPRNITVMMSFTMAVSAFTMPTGWNRTQYVAFSRWKPLAFSEVDYSRTCAANLNAGKLQQKQLFWVTGSIKDHYQIIYDTKETMVRKLNYSLLSYSKRRFGWALFDIDREDYDNTCKDDGGQGFYRARAIHEFLRSYLSVH